MKDLNKDQIKLGIDQAIEVLGERVSKKRMTQTEMAYKMALLTGTMSDFGFQETDLIIEAVVENQEIKKNLFKSIQNHLSETAILTTNTSTISINKLSEAINHKENFVGLHFFNPVHKMPLVEVIRGDTTSDETVVTVVDYAKKLGKTPIVVNDGAGFLVNRILFPYLNEACVLVEEGVDFKTLDKVMTRFGMPMGPITLLDVVGLDTSYKVGEVLLNAFPDRAVYSNVVKLLCDDQRLGQKNGLGFYKYRKKKKKGEIDKTVLELLKGVIKKDISLSKGEILDRMILPMILEATRILEDGIAACVRDIDMGMVLGTGFPPFRGGLLRYADSIGIQEIVKKCDPYIKLGKRYEPTQMLLDMAQKGNAFY